MWYACTALHDPAERFISLEVGKQPLFIWITMLYIKLLGNPLLAGRLVSVTAGLLTMLGVWLLTLRLFKNKSVALLAVIVFVLNPFAQLINRLGNFDSTVGMFYIWSLYFTVLLVQTVRLDVAYTLGFSLAGGILTKTNAFFSLYLLPVSFLIFDFRKSEMLKRVIKLLVLFGLAVAMANMFYLLLQLSPYYEHILWFNGDFVYPKREWLTLSIGFRVNLFRENALSLLEFTGYYITLPYLAMIIASLFFGWKQKRQILLLLAYWFLPMFALAVFSRGTSSRWIYPFSLPLLSVIAFGIFEVCQELWKRLKSYSLLAKRTFVAGVIFVVILYPATQTVILAINPFKANIPFVDSEQYLSCATWSIRDIVTELKTKAHGKKIFIGSRFPLGGGQQIGQIVKLYALPNSNIIVKGFDMSLPSYPANFFKYSKTMPAYFITYKQWQNQTKGTDKLKLVKELPSPYDPHCSTVLVYKVI